MSEYLEGYAAGYRSIIVDDKAECPYQDGSEQSTSWHKGWQSGRDHAASERKK